MRFVVAAQGGFWSFSTEGDARFHGFGFGVFSTRAGETDMLMRDSNDGAFEVYDIGNDTITFAGPMG